MKCENCILAKWNWCWITCPISNKIYEYESKDIPKKCPYAKMTLEEIYKISLLNKKENK